MPCLVPGRFPGLPPLILSRESWSPEGPSDPHPLPRSAPGLRAPCDLKGYGGGGGEIVREGRLRLLREPPGEALPSNAGNGSVLPIAACPSLTRGRRKAERAPLNGRELEGGGGLGRFLLSSRRLCRRGRPWPTPASAADPAPTATCAWPGAPNSGRCR